MCGYTCKGLYSHHVLLGDRLENVTGLGLGHTVYVFIMHVFCFFPFFSHVFFSTTVTLCTQLTLDDY